MVNPTQCELILQEEMLVDPHPIHPHTHPPTLVCCERRKRQGLGGGGGREATTRKSFATAPSICWPKCFPTFPASPRSTDLRPAPPLHAQPIVSILPPCALSPVLTNSAPPPCVSTLPRFCSVPLPLCLPVLCRCCVMCILGEAPPPLLSLFPLSL